jgi:hypothetical protein
MVQRVKAGRFSLYIFSLLNILMLMGPAMLPAYHSYIKIHYGRVWRNRLSSRKGGDRLMFTVSAKEFDQYREGDDEIWLGNRLYDIEKISKDAAGVHLQVEYDGDETAELNALASLQKTGRSGNIDISVQLLHWLNDIVVTPVYFTQPVSYAEAPSFDYTNYSSAIKFGYARVDQQPPDGRLIF